MMDRMVELEAEDVQVRGAANDRLPGAIATRRRSRPARMDESEACADGVGGSKSCITQQTQQCHTCQARSEACDGGVCDM